MIETHLRRLRLLADLRADEQAAIRRTVSARRSVEAGTILARARESRDRCLIIENGWVARTKNLEGDERQIIGLNLPGDCADLHAFALQSIDYDLVALTACSLAVVPHERLRGLLSDHPRLWQLYWLAANADAAIHREWIASLGRRSTLRRIAHLLCEIYLRLDVVGRTYGSSCDFPLTQHQLAEAVGATPIHVNRVLQELRGTGLIQLERRRLTILDADGLRAAAKFAPDYLRLNERAVDADLEAATEDATILIHPSCVSRSEPAARNHP